MPLLSYNAISTRFNHQILRTMAIDFDLYCHYSRKVYFDVQLTCEYVVSQFNLPTDFAVSVVTMYTLVYSSHVEYDKTNTSQIQK